MKRQTADDGFIYGKNAWLARIQQWEVGQAHRPQFISTALVAIDECNDRYDVALSSSDILDRPKNRSAFGDNVVYYGDFPTGAEQFPTVRMI